MSAPAVQGLVLYTFEMSHYSEKIRWVLDDARIAYREVAMTPAFHIVPALRMGRRGQTTLPILATPKGAIQDSPRILQWLAYQHAPLPALPAEQADAIRAVERRFDAIGKDVARLLYTAGFGRGDAHILDLWTAHATPWQARVIRRGYPLIRWVFRRKLNITPAGAARAQERIGFVVDWLDAQLSTGRRHLVGDRLTAADITAAALLAPLACPTEHPVYGEAAYRQSMAPAIDPWHGRPAMQWVREVYRVHRREPSAMPAA